MNKVTPTMKVIEVSFNPDRLEKLYSYYTHEEVEVGGWVVIRKPNGEPSVACIITTEGFSASAIQAASKCIVCKIDFEAYERRTEELKLIREIKNELKQRKEQLDESIIYAQLAQSDPVMQGLIERMNAITPGAIPVLKAKCTDEYREAGTTCNNCKKK